MEALTIIYLLVFLVFALVGSAILQIRMAGIKIKDYWGFIQANQMLDKLYRFSKRYKLMSPQEQIIFLAEAEKVLMHMIKFLQLYGKMNIENIQKCYKHIKMLE